ncbi:MAG: NAD(P)H-binding protein [Myxococcales bacterium]|nr:NAD(P)H-binding protein [Myxococcales bacterium]
MSGVLVTGATGNVGQEVVRALSLRSVPVLAADRQPERVLFGDQLKTARLDFLDRETWPAALDGVEHMFLMRPPAIADVTSTLVPFVDEARARGVDHVVFLSVAGAGKNRVVPHRKVEDHLRARGAHHTNLRPGFFAQNLQSSYRDDIIQDGRIYVPAGTSLVRRGPCAPVRHGLRQRVGRRGPNQSQIFWADSGGSASESARVVSQRP